MGDPRKLRKKYSTPSHPWQKLRIDEERSLIADYGFKNKKELWKLNSLLKKFKLQMKELIPRRDEEAEKQKKQLVSKLFAMGLVKENAIPEDVLGITLKDLCERRLQTVVVKRSLAHSIKQARQFITHEHIMIGEMMITSPSYIISTAEEGMLRVADKSPLASEDHPERVSLEKQIKEEMKEAGLSESPAPEKKREQKKSARQELKEDVKREEAEEGKEE